MMSNLIRWEPFEGLTSLGTAMRDLYDRSLVSSLDQVAGMYDLLADVYERGDDYIIQVALPGVKPEDISVTVVGNTLSIECESKADAQVKQQDYIRRERRCGKFSRTVSLPGNVPADQVKAEYENGLLTLTVPKAEEVRTKKIQVKSK